jgi:hypothetical protein
MDAQIADVVKLAGLFERSSNVFGEPVVQLFRTLRGRPDPVGTGVLIEHRGHTYLVSANHCFDSISSSEGLYYFNGGFRQVVGLHSSARWTDDPSTEIDLGVLRIDPKHLPAVRPLTFSNALPLERPTAGQMLYCYGYPASKTRLNVQTKRIKSAPRGNSAPAVSADLYRHAGLDPKHHIAMHFHRGKVLNSKGDVQKFPQPHGMSGSPVWLLKRIRDNTTLEFGLIGILTRYLPQHSLLVGVTIEAAHDVILKFDTNPN